MKKAISFVAGALALLASPALAAGMMDVGTRTGEPGWGGYYGYDGMGGMHAAMFGGSGLGSVFGVIVCFITMLLVWGLLGTAICALLTYIREHKKK